MKELLSLGAKEPHFSRYKNFILSRPGRDQTKQEGYEIHHIIPKALGGGNQENNLIKLTYREHFIAHLMLWMMELPTMAYTFFLFSGISYRKQFLTSRQYEFLKKSAREDMLSHRKNSYSVGVRRKMSLAKKGKISNRKGIPWPAKQYESVSRTKSKKVLFVEENQIYSSFKDCIAHHPEKQLTEQMLYKVCSGQYSAHRGYHFQYA